MYSTNKLKTAAECDYAIAIAADKKGDLQFEQTGLSRDLTGQEKSNALTNAALITTNAQITGLNAALSEMPEGEAKMDLQSQLRRLNDKKENLEERLRKGGAAAFLQTELEAELSKKQVEEIDAFIESINNRKKDL